MDYIRKYWFLVLMLIVICVLLFIYIISPEDGENEAVQEWEESIESNSEVRNDASKSTTEEISSKFVDVKGEVNKPGVYEIKDGYRVLDVIKMA